jgi:hypothetical protein
MSTPSHPSVYDNMAQSLLPPPVLTSYKLVDEPVRMPVEEPVPVEETVYRGVPVEEPLGEPIGRVPVEEPVPMPVEEPAPVKEEQIMHRNQIMQHPSGSEGWLPTEDVAPPQMPEPRRHEPIPVRRTSIVSSARIKDNDNLDATIAANAEAASATPRRTVSLGRAGSKKGVPTTTEARPIPGSAFLGGAGATGPKSIAEEDAGMMARNQEAHASLTSRQRSRIAKTEGGLNCCELKFPFCLIVLQFPQTAKHDKQISRIIKREGKAEKTALAIAIKELDRLQCVQKRSINVCQLSRTVIGHAYIYPFSLQSEAQAQNNVSELNDELKKAESDFLNAKMRCDTVQATVNTAVEVLEALRAGAREATEHVQRKSAEVSILRSTLAVDEREREVRLTQLKGVGAKSPGFWS